MWPRRLVTIRRTSNATRLAWLVAISLMACLFITGCPTDHESGGATDTCEKIGQQCRLGGGQLGVCTMSEDNELECMSQH